MQHEVRAPMAATVVEIAVAAGDVVAAGQCLAIVEAMKMEHELHAERAGRVEVVLAAAGEMLDEGDVLLRLVVGAGVTPADAATVATAPATAAPAAPAAPLRPDLAEWQAREALTRDAARPEAMARRHAQGRRSVRENLDDLCDPGSFVEYGALAYAAQATRRPVEDLIRQTPADGLVGGLASIEGRRCVVLAYDPTVLAGTQGLRNHQKTDRLIGIALEQRLPVVLFAEGGGGRPGDVDVPIVAGLHLPTFANFARLSGRVPLVGIAAGRCFAGNAALLGCCDLIVATKDSNIGLGGPAMVEGGGLGLFAPEQIGPSDVQSRNGVIDVLVADEAEAVAVAKRCLAWACGTVAGAWSAADPQRLRDVLPAQRTRSHAMREVMALVADTGSLVELRPGFGAAVLTALARLEGRPIGLLASNPMQLGGAIDAAAADKAARFLRLCDVHGVPVVSLIDTPGFMVGPDSEAEAHVRHASRLFVAAANLRVPLAAVVLRKGYGLGAMALAGGGFHVPVATAAWPSGEFGAMGLEGAVRLGYRKELEAEPDEAARQRRYEALLARHVEAGKAIHMAEMLEIDAVIDPARTREWLVGVLSAATVRPRAPGGLDPW